MQVSHYPGNYIMLEGEEGAGKTTQLRLLEEKIKRAGHSVRSVKEPSRENVFGELAYAIYSYESERDRMQRSLTACLAAPEFKLIKSEASASGGEHVLRFETIAQNFLKGDDRELPFLLQLAMIFSRRELLRTTILPTLEKGTAVLSDRGFFSTLAYGASEGLDREELLRLHEELLGMFFVVPNLVIILDVDPHEGLRRTMEKQGGKTDHFDSEVSLTKIRQSYLELARDNRFGSFTKVLDGASAPEKVHAAIWREAEPFLGPR